MHSPAFDTTTHAGRSICELFRRIKDLAHADGIWPGADVVDTLTTWFAELGVDLDGPADIAALHKSADARTGPVPDPADFATRPVREGYVTCLYCHCFDATETRAAFALVHTPSGEQMDVCGSHADDDQARRELAAAVHDSLQPFTLCATPEGDVQPQTGS